MQVFIRFLIAVCLCTALGTGCRTTKKLQTAITKIDTVKALPKIEENPNAREDSIRFIQETFEKIERNQIDFRTFSAKIKVDFEDKDGKKSDLTAFVRLRKDSIMWISINALLGIEAARVLITPDSVKVLNKIDHVYRLSSVEALQEIANVPFTFTELQNVIVGNPVYLDSNITSYLKNEKGISLVSIGEVFKQLLTVNNDYTLQSSKLDDIDPTRSRTCLVIYGDLEKKNNIIFSKYRQITVSEKNKVDIQMDYKQYSFNEELGYPFSIPRNYKRQ
jgi:Domain of unknown function (DUF4292)